jgi:hypothetical protein
MRAIIIIVVKYVAPLEIGFYILFGLVLKFHTTKTSMTFINPTKH